MCCLRLEMKIAIESAYIESSVVWFDPIAMCCRAYTERNTTRCGFTLQHGASMCCAAIESNRMHQHCLYRAA